jgi:hypothetical protein
MGPLAGADGGGGAGLMPSRERPERISDMILEAPAGPAARYVTPFSSHQLMRGGGEKGPESDGPSFEGLLAEGLFASLGLAAERVVHLGLCGTRPEGGYDRQSSASFFPRTVEREAGEKEGTNNGGPPMAACILCMSELPLHTSNEMRKECQSRAF